MLLGSVASAAAKVPLKASKTTIRERKIIFWTPVMIWPAGFAKQHKKETLNYRSDECLHNGKTPYLAVGLQGGVIIDLATAEIEKQIGGLLEIEDLETDPSLIAFLDRKIAEIKALYSLGFDRGTRAVEVIGSQLLKILPREL